MRWTVFTDARSGVTVIEPDRGRRGRGKLRCRECSRPLADHRISEGCQSVVGAPGHRRGSAQPRLVQSWIAELAPRTGSLVTGSPVPDDAETALRNERERSPRKR
jgi:hypothetical protein